MKQQPLETSTVLKQREASRAITDSFNSTETTISQRFELLRKLFCSFGSRSVVEPDFRCDFGKNVSIGDDVYICNSCVFSGEEKITIGNGTFIGPEVKISTSSFSEVLSSDCTFPLQHSPITIGKHCTIGCGAIISCGTNIPDHCVVLPGAVVFASLVFEPGTVVQGNPAKKIEEKVKDKIICEKIEESKLTETEKLYSGEKFDFFAPEIVKLREECKEMLKKFPQVDLTKRREYFAPFLSSCGPNVTVLPPFRAEYMKTVSFKGNAFVNYNMTILGAGKITIGEYCWIAPDVKLITTTSTTSCHFPITIGNDVWIGGAVIIMGNVTIGNRCVVGAGSVVTENIPDDSLVVGNPAKVIKIIKEGNLTPCPTSKELEDKTKTQKQKMLSGMFYTDQDDELFKDKKFCSDRLLLFNATKGIVPEERHRQLKELFGALGEHSFADSPLFCDYGIHIYVGKNTTIGANTVTLDVVKVDIGDNVRIANDVKLYPATHPLLAAERRLGEFGIPITISSQSCVGVGSILCPGVTIGVGCVVRPGAVVTRNIPDGNIVQGAPARIVGTVKKLEE